MKIVSLNVGLPREVLWHGDSVRTSIFKAPVDRRLQAKRLDIEGDEQSDLKVHGGPNKAIYVYPSEHYAFWSAELPGVDLPWGSFGENLTTAGVLEADARVGDRWRVGSAEFVVRQPRLPCFKLGVRFGRDDIVKRFLASRRTGFYLSVLREGEIGTGDSIECLPTPQETVSISEVVELYVGERPDASLLRRAAQALDLPESWREEFREQILATHA